MPLDNPPHISQPNPGAFKFINPVQTLKDAKELVGISHVKTDAVIADKKDPLGLLARLTTDFDFRLRTASGKFQGIREEVDQHLAQHRPVAGDDGEVHDTPVNGPA